MKALLIDTDPGGDDAIAIAYALRSVQGKVVGVAASAGNAVLGVTADLAARTLDYLGAGRVPLALGSDERDSFIRGTGEATALQKVAKTLPLPSSRRRPSEATSELILQALQQYGSDLILVALAPLTNIAKFAVGYPEEFRLIQRVVVLGGAFGEMKWTRRECPGAELNIYMDTAAAQHFFAAGHPDVTLLSLDTANGICLTAELADRLSTVTTPEARLAVECYTHWCNVQGGGEMPLWDPVTVAVALDSSLVQFERRSIGVLPDGRTVFARGGPAVNYVSWIDANRFMDYFMTAMGATPGVVLWRWPGWLTGR